MKDKIIETIKNKKLIIFSIVSIVFFGILINTEFATDTYTVFTVGAKQDIMHFLQNGRLLSAFFTAVVKILSISNNTVYLCSFLIAIVALTISMFELEKLINKDIKNNALSIGVTVLIIINPFIIELFLFIEKGVLLLSILFNVLAVKYFERFLEEKNIKELIKVLILMFLANGAYQGTVGLFLVLALYYILKYSKNAKEFIINNIIAVGLYAIPAILNLVIAKMMNGARISGKIVLSESIQKIFESSKKMFLTYDIIPKVLLIMFVVAIAIITIYIIVTNKNKGKNVLKLFYLILGTILIAIAPQIMQNTETIWLVPRSTYVFASIYGIILLFISTINENETKKFAMMFIGWFLLVELFSFQHIIIDHYKLNYIDKLNSERIGELIQDYQNETGRQITKICLYNDKIPTYTYNGLFISGDINVSGFATSWSAPDMINYYNNLKLEKTENDDDIQKAFEQKDWNNYSDDQVILKDDTLHFCRF